MLIDAGAARNITTPWSGIVLDKALAPCWGEPDPVVLQKLLAAGLNPEAPMPNLEEQGEKPNSIIGYFRDYSQKGHSAGNGRAQRFAQLLDMLTAADKNATANDPEPRLALTLAAMQPDNADQRSFDETLKRDRTSFADSSVHTSTLQADAAMLLAIQKGDAAALRRILEHAVDPHTFDPDRFGSTPAYWAVHFNQLECLKLLLDHFAEDDGPTHRSDKSALDLAQKAHPKLVPVLQEGVQRNRAVLTARLKEQLHSISIDLPAFSNAPLHDVVHFLIEAAAHAGYLERRVGVATLNLPPSTTLTLPARANVTLWDALETITSANNLRFDAKNDGAGMIMLYPPQAESVVHPPPAKTDNAVPAPASSTDATQEPVRVQLLAVDMDESEYEARREEIDGAVRSGLYLTLEKIPSAREISKSACPTTFGHRALLWSPMPARVQAECIPTRQNGRIALMGTIGLNSITKTIVNGRDHYSVMPIPGAVYSVALQVDPQKLEATPPQGILEPAAALSPNAKEPRRLFVFLSVWPESTADASAANPAPPPPATNDSPPASMDPKDIAAIVNERIITVSQLKET